MSRYAAAVAAYIGALGRDRVLVIDHARFQSTPAIVIGEVQRFIGVAERAPDINPALRINASGRRPALLVAAERAVRQSALMRPILRRAVPFSTRERARAIGRRTPEGVDSVQRAALRPGFAADVNELDTIVGPGLLSWVKDYADPTNP